MGEQKELKLVALLFELTDYPTNDQMIKISQSQSQYIYKIYVVLLRLCVFLPNAFDWDYQS